jgi:hypothetical protein
VRLLPRLHFFSPCLLMAPQMVGIVRAQVGSAPVLPGYTNSTQMNIPSFSTSRSCGINGS